MTKPIDELDLEPGHEPELELQLQMMPGEQEYTVDEKAHLDALLRDALLAEELFDLDELEEYASSMEFKCPDR